MVLLSVSPSPKNIIRLRRIATFSNGESWCETIMYDQNSYGMWTCVMCGQRMGRKDMEIAMEFYPHHAKSLSAMPTTNALEDKIHHYHLPYQRAIEFKK